MRSASSISAGEASVRWMLMPQPERAQMRPDRFAMGGEAREIGVAQILRPRRKHAERAGGMKKLRVARERIGLLDRIGDHHQFADRALGADGLDRARDVFGLREKIADHENHRTRRGGKRGRQRGLEAPRRRSSVAIASAKRSTTPWVANGRVRPRRPARSPPRTQRSAKASASKSGPVDLRHRRQTRSEAHRGRAVEPNPDRVRRLPFALAHESALFARGAAPVDPRRRLAREERPKLPEGLARSGAPPAMNAMPHGLRHAAGRDDEARQAGRESRGVPTDRGGERHCAERRRIIGSSWPRAARSPPKSSRPRRGRRSSAPCGA